MRLCLKNKQTKKQTLDVIWQSLVIAFSFRAYSLSNIAVKEKSFFPNSTGSLHAAARWLSPVCVSMIQELLDW